MHILQYNYNNVDLFFLQWNVFTPESETKVEEKKTLFICLYFRQVAFL